MLLTLSTTHQPATDLGYQLYKNAARPQAFDPAFGRAHVFYPERSAGRCTAALLLVLSVLRAAGAKRVLDLGCSYGNLLRRLLEDRAFEQIVGLDVSHRALVIAAERLHLDDLPERQRARIRLMYGSLTYRDPRLPGFDAAAVVEVIEHLDPPRLAEFERVLFEVARPATVVVTTPNVEYDIRFETLPAGQYRHRNHRFEWTRQQFRVRAEGVADRFGCRSGTTGRPSTAGRPRSCTATRRCRRTTGEPLGAIRRAPQTGPLNRVGARRADRGLRRPGS